MDKLLIPKHCMTRNKACIILPEEEVSNFLKILDRKVLEASIIMEKNELDPLRCRHLNNMVS